MKRFFWAIFHPSKLKLAIGLCVTILLFGTTGYMLLDNYSLLDAFYMAVITISTVGYGEVNPLSEQGRIFTTILILTGFATLGFAGHAIVESLLEKVWSGDAEMKKMRKKIESLSSHYIICGFGRVGDVAAMQLKRAGVDFLIVEFSPEQCQIIKEHGFLFVEGDGTREDVLLEAGIKRASGLLALLDSDPKNLFIALTARELNPTLHIISRSEDKRTERKILRAGADSVISPHATAGRQIADDLLAATGHTAFLSEESPGKTCSLPQWITVHQGSSMLGRTIADISKEMGQEVLGLRRVDHDILQPDPAIILEMDDILLVIDETEEGGTDLVTKEIVPRKVVIVDDNPVIVRLYSRLFKKAGFNPICATNGEDAFKIILEEKPEVAVVDFMLPGCSGIDVCRKVRSADVGDILLILFTSDEKKETRDEALKAGADKVVIKGPEASDVIEQVVQLLQKKSNT